VQDRPETFKESAMKENTRKAMLKKNVLEAIPCNC
jgi:hypothetical protein